MKRTAIAMLLLISALTGASAGNGNFYAQFLPETTNAVDLNDQKHKFHTWNGNKITWESRTSPTLSSYSRANGYYDDTIIGLVGSQNIKRPVTITFKSNSGDGGFVFRSQTAHDQTRKFKIAVNGRCTGNVNDRSMTSPNATKYGGNDSSFFITDGSMPEYSFTMQPTDGSLPNSNGTPVTDRWADLILILEGADGKKTLGAYNDYMASITVTVTTDDPEADQKNESYIMTLWGYAGETTPDSDDLFNFSLVETAMAKNLNLSTEGLRRTDGAKVATINASRYSRSLLSRDPGRMTRYDLYISATNSIDRNGETFRLRKRGATHDNRYNSIAYKILYDGTVATYGSNPDTNQAYNPTRREDWLPTTVSGWEFKGDNERHLAVPCFISERPASNNWYSATYNIAGSLSFKIEDGEDPSMLTAGIYQSSVYLFIVSN